MKIKDLKIYSKNLSQQIDFYSNTIGLKVIENSEKRAVFQVGNSRITFEENEKFLPYHFAINIPCNKEDEALSWLKERVEILKDEQNEIQDFDFWNAKAIYFYDSDKNIIEFIARKNMKNEIDELFYQKLTNLHIKPSESAKAQFIALVEKKNKKKPVWYFSAAASLILLSSMGLFVLNQNPKTEAIAKANITSSVNDVIPSVAKKGKDNTAKLVIKSPFIDSQLKVAIAISKHSNKKKELTKFKNPIKGELALIENPKISLTGISEIDELFEDQLTIAFKNAENKKKKEFEESIPKPGNDFFQKSVGETIIIVSSYINIEEDIYIPNINSDSPISLAEATDLGMAQMNDDRSLIAKVFKEIKHLKHGEKVSLNSLSASSEPNFLNSDDSFIGHETIEFRQRFNWIKDKLSKDY